MKNFQSTMFAHSHTIEVHDATHAVLSAWGLQDYKYNFLSCTDGVALVAHLCDAGVEFSGDDDTLYDLFRPLVKYAAELHPLARYADNVLHIQTVVGPISIRIYFSDAELSEMGLQGGYPGAHAAEYTLDWAQKMAEMYLGL